MADPLTVPDLNVSLYSKVKLACLVASLPLVIARGAFFGYLFNRRTLNEKGVGLSDYLKFTAMRWIQGFTTQHESRYLTLSMAKKNEQHFQTSPEYDAVRSKVVPLVTADFTGIWMPKDDNLQNGGSVLLYLPGGGYSSVTPYMFIFMLLDFHKQLKDKGHSISILFMCTKLSPEYKYPAQLLETAKAYDYLINTLHIDPNKIIFAGDSSGAHILLQLLRHIHQPHPLIANKVPILPKPKSLILMSPVIRTVNLRTGSFKTNLDTDYVNFNKLENDWFAAWKDGQDKEGLCEHINRPQGALPWKQILPDDMLLLWGANEALDSDVTDFLEQSVKDRCNVVVERLQGQTHDLVVFGYLTSLETGRKLSQPVIQFLEEHT